MIGQRKARLLATPPAFAHRPHAELAAFWHVDAEEANALAVDFNGVTVDYGSDANDAILRDRTQPYGQGQQ